MICNRCHKEIPKEEETILLKTDQNTLSLTEFAVLVELLGADWDEKEVTLQVCKKCFGEIKDKKLKFANSFEIIIEND